MVRIIFTVRIIVLGINKERIDGTFDKMVNSPVFLRAKRLALVSICRHDLGNACGLASDY